MSIEIGKIARHSRLRRAFLVAAVSLFIVFAAIFFWRSARVAASAAAYAPPPVEVSVLTIQPESLPQPLSATGVLEAVRGVMLAPDVAGRVTRIHIASGATVRRGEALVDLFDAPEQADRAAAVARARFAEIQFQRSRQLVPDGAESLELLQQRQAELSQTRAAIRQLDARIFQKKIRAPFAGSIGILRINLGQYVNAGDPVATLTALDRLVVNFSLPQQMLSRLRVGQAVVIRSDSMPGRDVAGRINAVEPHVAGDTRNVSVQAEVPNSSGTLRPGLFVAVDVAQPARGNAILVPSTAVQTSTSGDSVYVVRQGKAVLVPVTAGSEIGDRTLIENGLKPGDVVITTGQLRLQPDAAVKIAASPASSPAQLR